MSSSAHVPSSAAVQGGLGHRRLGLLAILGGLTAFAPMSIDMYLPALPAIERDFGAAAGAAQLTLAAFFLGLALGQSFYGPIADRYGRKPPLYGSMLVFVVATVGCALAPTIDSLVALRFLQALGTCAGAVIARAIVRDLFDVREATRVYSMLMLVMGLAPTLAPFVGGYLMTWAGWRAIFLVLAGIGVVFLLGVHFLVPETHRPENRRSLRVGRVLADYALLARDRRFLGYTLTFSVSLGGMFAFIAGAPFVYIELYGIAPHAFGWYFGANALGLVLAAQLNYRLGRRYGPDRVLRTANAAQVAAGLVLLGCALTGFGGLAGLAAPLFVYIACIGLVMPNAVTLAMAPFGHNAGVASALLGTVQFGCAAVAAALVSLLQADSALPMAGIVAASGVGSAVVHRLLVAPAPAQRRSAA
ncbi:MAG: Bcr/CflA family multidrug efflux MFS transporter [Rhodospirillales bacterium]